MRWPKWLIDPEQDEYYSRVDDEIREAGEKRYPLGFTIFLWLLLLAIIGVNGYTVWRYFH